MWTNIQIKCPEFINLIRNYDIVGIQEPKTDDTDVIEIPGFISHH